MKNLRQEVGSLLICGFEGTTLPRSFVDSIENHDLAGVILFARNYVDTQQLKKLTNDIHTIAGDNIFIAVDQEGGRVARFTGDFPVFPSPHYFGKSHDLQGLLHATKVTAEYLKATGVNLNLIPVCDLSPTDTKHVIHSRSYSDNPSENSLAVSEQVRVLNQVGILSCAKHFPGLASAYGDPHFEVSRSDRSIEEFRALDYPPFRAAISAGVSMIMVTHLLAPAFDSENIVTFSTSAIRDELRKNLKFDGVVISDDLQMAGSLTGITAAEAGIKSLKAGCDLLIFGNVENPVKLIEEISSAAEKETELLESIQRSCKTISDFRDKSPILAAHESSTS